MSLFPTHSPFVPGGLIRIGHGDPSLFSCLLSPTR